MTFALPPADGAVSGLPYIRSYSLDEIGDVARGAQLKFDPFGRVGVLHEGAYFVLNDSSWQDMLEKAPNADLLAELAHDPRTGETYYGALNAWGRLVHTPEGTLRPVSLRPETCPAWTSSTTFGIVVPALAGVCFAGPNGFVYRDRATGESRFFQVPQLLALFELEDSIYISSRTRGLLRMGADTEWTPEPAGPSHQGIVPRWVTRFGSDRVLVSTDDNHLYVVSRDGLQPWGKQLRQLWEKGIHALEQLPDGDVAVVVGGVGVQLVSQEGELKASLSAPELDGAHHLAAREDGVLWVATESGVHKVLYGGGVGIVDHRLGMSIRWAQVVAWKGRTIVASGGRLYESVNEEPGLAVRFQSIQEQPDVATWAIASDGEHLLIGNDLGIQERQGDGSFVTILSGISPGRLVMTEPGLCYALADNQLTVLRHGPDGWRECVARVPGVGFSYVVHATKTSVWLELGTNRAARVALEDGKLDVRLFQEFPWNEPRWVNIGIVGDIVVMSGPMAGRLYFDEARKEICETAPAIAGLLASSPYWIARMREDHAGNLWATHERGVSRYIKTPEGYALVVNALDTIRDRFPIVQIVGEDEVWISDKHALYVLRSDEKNPRPQEVKPVLVSVLDVRTGRALGAASGGQPARYSHSQNSLAFRFFAGTYRTRDPSYTFRVSSPSGDWKVESRDSELTLPGLAEGDYQLHVQAEDGHGGLGHPTTVMFSVAGPWYRTWPARFAGGTLGVLGLLGIVQVVLRRTKARNRLLEDTVEKRTVELRSAIHQLKEETRNSATLAERARLAGEIHDSLQQGLSGVMLQVDATMRLSNLPEEVRERLKLTRNMVSFTRAEVQHAVWGLESPYLQDGDLPAALRAMASAICQGSPHADVKVVGAVQPLESAMQHHLLRVGQEALTNAVRHGAAQQILLTLRFTEGAVELSVTDDGVGFSPDAVLADSLGHFGLRGLRARVNKLDGTLDITSAPGRGTCLQVTVPLSSPPLQPSALH